MEVEAFYVAQGPLVELVCLLVVVDMLVLWVLQGAPPSGVLSMPHLADAFEA